MISVLTSKSPALTHLLCSLPLHMLFALPEKGCVLLTSPFPGSPRFNYNASYSVKLSLIPLQNELFPPLCDHSIFFMFLFEHLSQSDLCYTCLSYLLLTSSRAKILA